MIFQSNNTKAKNGFAIHSCVELKLDEADTRKTRFFSSVMVAGCNMAHSHHYSRKEAAAWADKMHKSYMEVHSK